MRLYIVTCTSNIHGIGLHAKSEKIYLGCYDTKKEAEDAVERESRRRYPYLVETGRIEFRDSIKISYDREAYNGNEFEFNIYFKDVEDPSVKENKDLQVQVRNLTDQVEYLKKYIKAHGSVPVEPEFNSKPTKKEEPKNERKFSF